MKHTLFLSALMCAMLTVSTAAFAKQGDSWCDPIPLGKDYSTTISKTGTVYYSANTFDLPLTVYFKTSTPNQPPIVEMDFTCHPGVYEDSILCSLFCKKTGSGGIEFDMPYKPELNVVTLEDGSFAYFIAMGKTYRDLLMQMGIDYNVVVYIKVTYKSTGTMTMTPDAFGNCMDGYKFMHAGDTIKVLPNDKSRHVIVPYIQWMEDSIRYVWNGTAPLQLSVATECEFDPTDNSNPKIANFKKLQPKDTFKLTSANLKYYVTSGDYSSEAGMFFAKWYTTGSGTLKIERVPQAPPRDGATLLRYNKATDVVASDTLVKTYAIPFTWTEDLKFTTPTNHVFKLYVGTDPKFTPKQAIASYQFLAAADGHWLGLYANEMEALWKKTSEQYLYIKIWCTEKTTITPQRWYPSECLKTTVNLPARDTAISILSDDARIFRMHYAQWKGGKISLKFSQTDECKAFFSDTCFVNTISTVADYLIYYDKMKKGKTLTIAAEKVNSWESRVKDKDGFIYLYLYCETNSGTVTIKTNAPAEQDPAPIVYPAATVHVTCGEKELSEAQNVTVKVSIEQDIIIYDATSTKVAEWHQLPTDAPHSVKLQPGDYTLSGKDEKIAILIKN